VTDKCPYCQSESSLYFRSKDYNRKVFAEIFNHFRCPRCKLIFLAPIPSNLNDYYPEAYYSIPNSPAYLEAASAFERYKIELVKSFVEKGRLLEIGSSYGTFAYLAKKAGFEVEAIEMNEQCCAFLNTVVGVRAINSSEPIKVLQQAEHYDVVAMWHVIEHMVNPWAMLDSICASLKPGGLCVVASPNPNALQFRIMGRYWPHVDAPRHLMLIPMKLLREKMAARGMKTVLATTRDQGSIAWNYFGWEFLFANLVPAPHVYVKRALRLVGKFSGICLGPFERKEGKGSAYTMIFRKEV
jgi:2-polyprenyl-3-methyl-5-hydroxy-6-metoxy-1,4-benzoquinol methylase